MRLNLSYKKKVNEMVSKSFKLLSLSMPVAMVIGTSIAIEFSRYSSLMLLIFSAFAGLIVCVYLIIKRSQRYGFPYNPYNLCRKPVTTK
jgi:hypothetical protein